MPPLLSQVRKHSWYADQLWCCACSFPGKGEGVTIEGASTSAAPAKPAAAAPAAPAVPAPAAKAPAAAAADDDDDDDDDDEDLDLFGELTEVRSLCTTEHRPATSLLRVM